MDLARGLWEGCIYANGAKDYMNWRLVMSFTLGLGVSLFNMGIAAQPQTLALNTSSQSVRASVPSERQVVSYTVDTSTVSNWDTLNVGNNFIDISGVPKGSVDAELPTKDNPVVYVSLLVDDVSKSGGGEDVLVLGKKHTLEFSAENTAKAGLISFVPAFNVTLEETLQAYDMFANHPKFNELVAIYETHKGYPADFDVLGEAGTLAGEIVSDIMTQLRQKSVAPAER